MAEIAVPHRRRLREIWRSAGWPCQDAIEIELLAAGLLERVRDGHGRETLRVTDAGIDVLAQTLKRNRAKLDAHEALVERVACAMQRAGRIVWRGLSLRAKVDDAWGLVMPDVFSIRHTTVEAYLDPVVHEIKVSRADLLSDLRRTAKGAAYLALSSECWYVIRAGIARADEIPEPFGVLAADECELRLLRPAGKRAFSVPFHLWMALARAAPLHGDDDAQRRLGDLGDDRP
jgi:hypothetical protein